METSVELRRKEVPALESVEPRFLNVPVCVEHLSDSLRAFWRAHPCSHLPVTFLISPRMPLTVWIFACMYLFTCPDAILSAFGERTRLDGGWPNGKEVRKTYL